MAAAVTASYNCKLDVAETVALALDNVEDPPINHATTNEAKGSITGTTTVPATKAFSDDITLATGRAALDLTALAGPASTTIDFTGLKLQCVKLVCPNTNTKPVTVHCKNGVTGYNLFGANNTLIQEASLLPAVRTATATGGGIDLNDVLSCGIFAVCGTIVDGTHTLTIEESSDDGAGDAYTTVAGADLTGVFAAFTSSVDDTTQYYKYIGDERYIRAVLTVTGGPATGGPISVVMTKEPGRIDVLPGQGVLLFLDDEAEDVGTTAKDILFHGTGTESIEVILVAG